MITHRIGMLALSAVMLAPATARSQTDLSAAPAPTPRKPAPAAQDTNQQLEEPALPSLHRVTKISEDGLYLTLGDGSKWEVYMADRLNTKMWKVGDVVMIRERPDAIGDYPFVLYNGRDESSATVKWRGYSDGSP